MIPCTFRQLEIFMAAAEDCHFVRTAHRLGISQPAVTHHILALESQLGKKLFIRRRGTTPVLSTDGAAFLKQTRQLLAEGEKIKAFRSSDEARQRTTVRVCAGQHLFDDCIKPRLSEFYREEGDIVIDCRPVLTLQQGIQTVKKGQADLLVLSAPTPQTGDLHGELLRQVRFCLYGSREFRKYKSASAAELSALPFILPPEGSYPDQMVQEALAQVGVFCANVVIRVQFASTQADLARSGLGVAALFETMVEEDVASGALVQFDLELPPRYRMMYRAEARPTPAVARVQDFLTTIL